MTPRSLAAKIACNMDELTHSRVIGLLELHEDNKDEESPAIERSNVRSLN